MTVQASELTTLLRQANTGVSDPADAPPPSLTTPIPAQDPLASKTVNPQLTAAKGTDTNAAPAASGSFSKRYGSTFGDLFMLKGMTGGVSPDSIMPMLTLSGIKAMSSAPEPEGNTTWDAAQSNADQTPETKPANTPQPRTQGFRDALETLAAGANAPTNGGGAAQGFFAGVEGNLKATREQQKDRILMATSNAQMLHEQALTHKLGEDQINAATESGKQGLNLMMSAHVPGTLVAEGKTSDQIQQMIKNKQLDPTQQTVFLTGRIPVGRDANGEPIFRSTYSVVQPGGPVKFDAARNGEREFLNNYLHMDIAENQELPAVQVNHLWQQAQNAMASQAAVEQNLEQVGLKRDAAQARQAAKELDTQDFWINALASNDASTPGHPDPYRLIKTYRSLLGHGVPKDMPNFSEVFKNYVGGEKNFDILEKDYDKAQQAARTAASDIVDVVSKDPTKMEGKTSSIIPALDAIIKDPTKSQDEKNRAVLLKKQAESTRQMEIDLAGAKETNRDDAKRAAQQAANNPKNLTGTEFINSLPSGRRASLQAIYDGSIAVNPAALERTDKGQAFMDDIYAAYPDFQAYKGMEWPKAYADAMANGKVYQAKNVYNTALQHMVDLYNTSTYQGIMNPLSDDYRKRDSAKAFIVGELGKAVKGGVITQGESEDIEKKLSGWTPADGKTRAAEAVKLLKEKIDEYQRNFQDAAPSQQIKVPSLISQKGQAAYDYIINGGKTPEQARQDQTHGGAIPQRSPASQIVGYKVGQIIHQGGHAYTIKSLNPDGTIKETE